MSVGALLNTTCTIQRKTTTVGASGGLVHTWASLATLPCAVNPATSSEDVRAARETGFQRYTVFLPAGTDITNADRITAIGTLAGVTMALVGPPKVWNQGSIAYIECVGEEVKGGGTT